MESSQVIISILAIAALYLLLLVIGVAAYRSGIIASRFARRRWWGWTLAIALVASLVIIFLVAQGLTAIVLALLALPLLFIIIGNLVVIVRNEGR